MSQSEERYRVISALLQAGRPMEMAQVASEARLSLDQAVTLLDALIREKLVVQLQAVDGANRQFCWRARWEKDVKSRANTSRRTLGAIVASVPDGGDQRMLDIESDAVVAFNDYVIDEYSPPADKRFLVILQCSIRRPFSSSPSHGTLRRAVAVATGFDPRKQFERCPVHVVVLASTIGPVPYELEDVYPANLRGGGVKHFDPALYQHVRPILAERMARYLLAHRDRYERIATFTDGRYAEVMRDARKTAMDRCAAIPSFAILPDASLPTIQKTGKYWNRYWNQLYDEIVSWLPEGQRREAAARLGLIRGQ